MAFWNNLWQKREDSSRFVTIDLGSSRGRVLEWVLTPEGQAELVHAATAEWQPGQVVEGALLDPAGVTSALAASLREMGLENSGREVVVGIGSEVCLGLSTGVRVKRSQPEAPLAEKELREIQKRLEEAAFLEAARQLAETTGHADLDISLVESRLVSVKADDFLLSDPLGYKGERLEVNLFTAFTPTAHLHQLEKMCQELKLSLMQVASTVSALALGLAGPRPWELNALVVDLGELTTEVGLIFGGGVVGNKVLDLGSGTFTQQLAQSLGLSVTEAEAKKIEFSGGRLSPEETEKVAQSLQRPLDWWLSGVKVCLEEFSGVKSFPTQLYLAGGGVQLPLIKENLTAFPWTKDLPFLQSPQVDLLTLDHLTSLIDPHHLGGGGRDVVPFSLAFVGREILAGDLDEHD